jgi:hypothetical protein
MFAVFDRRRLIILRYREMACKGKVGHQARGIIEKAPPLSGDNDT